MTDLHLGLIPKCGWHGVSRKIGGGMVAIGRRYRLLIAATSIAFISVPAAAGLFGSIGGALGIGGAVGDALGFADKLLPGGGGVTDDILGAPAKSVFGGAIRDWKDANSQSIDKLGQTNDTTVKKLISGLGEVQADFNKGLQENVLLFSDRLDGTIGALDLTLQSNIDRLDNSLNNQTGRLDTVFEKQTNSLFTLGRVLLTVLIVGFGFFGVINILSDSKEAKSVRDIFNANRVKISVTAFLAITFLGLTWLWPNPTRISDLQDQLIAGYEKSLSYDDYVGADYSASQLQILNPDDALFRSYELKSRAMRDLFYRPTVLLNSDKFYDMMSALSRADRWHLDATKQNDPDIASLFTLLSMQSFKTNADFMRAIVIANKANEIFALGSADNNWRSINNSLAFAARGLTIESGSLRDALDGAPQEDIEKVIKEFTTESLTWAKSNSRSGRIDYSPVDQMQAATINKLVTDILYRNLLSYYFDEQLLKISGAPIADQRDQACRAFKYFLDWQAAEFLPRHGSETFVAQLLSGPYTVLSKLKATLPSADACPHISDAAIASLADPSSLWIAALGKNATGASERNGSLALTALAASLSSKQTATLDAYEALVATMVTYGQLKAQGDNGQKAAHDALLQWLSASTLMGMHTKQGDKDHFSPALSVGLMNYSGDLSKSDRQQLAIQYLYSPIY